MHIGLNAQLLSTSSSYRSAGVSTYSLHLLRELGALAAQDATAHRFTAWVNESHVAIPGVELVDSDLPLNRPPRVFFGNRPPFPVRCSVTASNSCMVWSTCCRSPRRSPVS